MINSALIKQLAAAEGFSDCGIARAERLGEEEYPLDEWLNAGCQADMHYMERNAEMRRDPRLLVEGARTVISLVVPYKPDRQMDGGLKISQYAYSEDYHEMMKRRMYRLIVAIKEKYQDFEARPFVDTAPISDRHWAVRAGMGWIGRNTLFVHPRFGSMCYLGEIVTAAEFDHYDEPYQGKCCAECRRCVDACPNHAITTSAVGMPMLDARRCTSYNTIENRAESLPADIDTRGYVFGCDICQNVCPFNIQAPSSFRLDDNSKANLESLPEADEKEFRRLSKHSALSRIKYPQWQRNIEKSKKTAGID